MPVTSNVQLWREGFRFVIENEGLVAGAQSSSHFASVLTDPFFSSILIPLSVFKSLFTTFACRLCRNSQRRGMGSPIDPSVRDSAAGGPFDFAESGGYSRKETEEFCPAVDFVSDDLRPFLAPEHLPALAPQAPEATAPSPVPGSSRLDQLYEADFRRLDRGLELLKAQPLVVAELPKVLEENVSAQIHVPSSVTQGYVPALGVLDVKAEGGVVYGSVLVERKAGVTK